MFPIQMSGQRDKLVTALGAVVSNVDELDKVVPLLEQLGRDHRRFSVVTEHYTAVGASLLATLKKFLGPSWTPDLADTWAQAYGLVAKVMVAAAEQHEDVAPASWEADVVLGRTTLGRGCRDRGRAAGGVPLSRWPVGGRGDPAAAPAVALLQPGERSRSVGASAVPHPADRRRPGLHAVVRRLSQGDTIRMGAPVGEQLTLPENGPLPDLLMVAGGTGLAPLRAVLEQIDRGWEATGSARGCICSTARGCPGTSTTMSTSAGLARKPWFDYTPVVSEDPTYQGARGLVGTVAAKAGDWSRPDSHGVRLAGHGPVHGAGAQGRGRSRRLDPARAVRFSGGGVADGGIT